MKITQNEKYRIEFILIYRYIAFYRYYGGNITYEKWYEIYSKLLNKLDACVDHMDNDLTNCTLKNLEIMKRFDNSKKGNIVLKCNKSPFKCYVYHEDDTIFMETGYKDGKVEINSKS